MSTDCRRMCRGAAFQVLALLLSLVAARAQQADATVARTAASQPLPEVAVAAVVAFQREHEVPGLSVAIGRGDGVLFAQGFGTADLENAVAATADTVYRLGSISKPIAAVAALQLVEQQRLQLDQDVRTWLPELPAQPWPMTLRQLLGHQAGVRHYRPGEGESTVHYPTQRSALERFAADPLLHEPGTRFFYSTYGYCLVAAAVEAGGGAAFPQVVARIAEQAQAPTLQDDDVRRLIPHRAQGYVRRDGELHNSALMDGSYKLGGGGLCSNAPDLVRFGLGLLDGRLLPPAALATMTTEQRTRDGVATGYGCGLRIGERGGRREYQHGGAQSRVSTVLVLWPEPRACAVVMCNLEGLRALPLAQHLLDLLAAGAPR